MPHLAFALPHPINREQPRAQEDWPDVTPQPVPEFDKALVPPDAPLSHLAQALAMGFLALVKELGQDVPEIKDPGALKGGEAIDLIHQEVGHLFPGLRQ